LESNLVLGFVLCVRLSSENLTMDTESKEKGIVALTMWLQTFPQFGQMICTDEKKANAEELFETVGSAKLTR